MLSRVSVGGRSSETSRAPDSLLPEPEIQKRAADPAALSISVPDRPKFLTTRVSGNDGDAAGGLWLSGRLDFIQDNGLRASRSLDLIQARDDAAAEDVGSFRPYFDNDVAEFAGIGHVLLVEGLRQVDLLDQRFRDRGGLDGQKILELLDRLPGDLALTLRDSLQTLHDRLVDGDQRLDVATLDVQNCGDVKTGQLERLSERGGIESRQLGKRTERRDGRHGGGVGTVGRGHENKS